MAKQYIPCPACGALGEIGSNCQFCNTTIVQKEGIIASDTRIVEKRTVTPQQYAEKISIYHDLVSLSKTYSVVEIGDQTGIINLNGDLIFPLERRNGSFRRISSSIVALEEKKTIQYYNLNTLETITTNKNGFIEDKNNPKKLHYLDPKNLIIKNEYINHKGETKTYDYAETLDQSHLSHRVYHECRFYIFHQENSLSLCLIKEDVYNDNTIEYLQKEYLNKYIIFLEGIKAIGKLEEIGKHLFLPIKMQNEEKIKLKIATLYSKNEYELDFSWDNWLNSTDPLKIKERKRREEEEKRIKQQEEEQQRKYANKLKLKRTIAKFFLCIAIITTILSWVIIFSGSESYLGGFELIWGLIGGPALGIISIVNADIM